MYSYIKVVLDVIFSFIGLVILSPLLVLILAILAIANKGNPFFVQQRSGKNTKPFYIIKLKTMNEKTDENGHLLSDAERLHFIGRILRKTSVDELPQLINVVKGDMSLVGPRPLLMEYLPLYNEEQKKRHNVRPGITGWAQVNGRNTISWQDKFKFDIWYVENLSITLDFKILCLTFLKVFKSEEVAQNGQATVEYFNGEN